MMQKSLWYLGLTAALSIPSVEAMNKEINALFQPDSSQPNKNVFVNKTPNSGYCAIYPAQCAQLNTFSIQLPVRFTSSRAIVPGEGIALTVPVDWRQLTVTNTQTQETETVEVRITGIGSNFFLSDSVADLTGVSDIVEAHDKLWTSKSWLFPPAPCQYGGLAAYTAKSFRFFWKTPVGGACTKVAAFRIPSMSFESMDFSYELRTPNPLGMSSGEYTGALSYSIGPGGDFDFGPLMQPDDSNLTLDFSLDVQHTLKVDLPPGGEKVTLEPEGGWQQWIDEGRKPTKIYRDQMFYLSASSRFKVMMLCNSTGGQLCNLFGGGKVVSVLTRLTLPAGITFSGYPVGGFPLRHNVWVGPFVPSQYVDRKAGSLQFLITRDEVDRLLKPGESASLSGNITIIWDSEV